MLTIPESVKALYKTDGVRKNFRAHFPGGEMADITNADIVRESLHFTESLCSQNNFRFGLAEASVLEFETVGVANMYGMTIQASIEIDVSSLTAAQIADIQAGTWDGELVDVSESDIGCSFFRIPLGVFRVEKCPRNHGAMTHRKVTAYTVFGGSGDSNSPFEVGKLANQAPGSTYTANVGRLIYAALGWNDPSVLSGFTKTAYGTWTSFNTATSTIQEYVSLSGTSGIRIKAVTTLRRLEFGNAIPDDKLYALSIASTDYAATVEAVETELEGISSIPEDDRQKFVDDLTDELSVFAGSGSQKYNLDMNIPVFYPKYVTGTAKPFYAVFVPEKTVVTVERMSGSTVTETIYSHTFDNLVTSPVLYQFTDNLDAIYLDFEATSKENGWYTFIDAYDFVNIITGWLEMTGRFGVSDRAREIAMRVLSPASPTAISPGDYEEAWWDEYDVSPIGTVTVTYKSGKNNTNTGDVSIGSGKSVYDMTGNEVLKALANGTLARITTILNGNFKTNAGRAGFTPIEMTMQGWPWMEAGDALKITAEDGTVVNTYALRVEMSGIQHLMSTITAEGGEIVGET